MKRQLTLGLLFAVGIFVLLTGPTLAYGPKLGTVAANALKSRPTPEIFVPRTIDRQVVGGKPGSSAKHSFNPAPRTKGQQHELAARRTRTSRTFVNDREFSTVVYAGSINYQDSAGRWQPIDNSLVATSSKGYAFQNKANRYTVYLPSDLSSAAIRVVMPTGWVSFTLTGAKAAVSIKGSTATYANALPGVTVAYTAGNDAMTETLTMENSAATHNFSYQVQSSAGLKPIRRPDGSIDFINPAGAIDFSFAAPMMYDSSKNPAATSRAVSETLNPLGSGYSLTMTPDPAWLSSAARHWPITIDPQVITLNPNSSPTQDCPIYKNAPTSQGCGDNLSVGYQGSTTGLWRSLVQFPIQGNIPSNVTVLDASLGMYLFYEDNTTSLPVGVYQLSQSWTTAVSWNDYDGTHAWRTPGGDFNATAAWTTNVSANNSWYTWSPVQLVQGWINGQIPNNGLIVKSVNESTADALEFAGTAYTDSSFWPYLTVTYDYPLGVRNMYHYETQRITDRIQLEVNVADGNLILHTKDFNIRGTGLNLILEQYYNNLSDNAWDFGNFWTLSTGWDIFLDTDDGDGVSFFGPSGYDVHFTRNSDGSFTAPTGIDATLSKNSDGTYLLKWNSTEEKYNFSAPDPNRGEGDAYLVSDQDKNGNTISFFYNSNGTLASIRDTQGRVTTFVYNANNFVTAITDPSGRQYLFTYDANNNMSSFTDPRGKTTNFTVDANNDLNSITDPDGNVTKLVYDSNWRVTSITRVTNPANGAGPTTTYTYNSGNTVSTDANGNKTTYNYDYLSRVTGITDALGNSTSLSYSADSNVATFTGGATSDGSLSQFQYGYDGLNNMTSAQSGVPNGPKTTAHYGANGASGHPYFPDSVTDTQSNTTKYQYDGNGNMTKATDALGHDTTYAYNSNGTVSSVTDASGHVTTFAYDAGGNLVTVAYPAPLGAVSYGYDSLSRVTSMTDGKGQKTTYVYDALDQQTQTTYADLTAVTSVFDPASNLTSLTDPTGTTLFTYDSLNRPVTKTLPSSQLISYAWDGANNMTSRTDNGGVVTMGYTAVNLLSSLKDQVGATTTFQYDKGYRRTQLAYPNGVTVTEGWNTAGQLTSIQAKNRGGTVLASRSYSYVNPATGLPTAARYTVTDQSGNHTTFAYDVLDRLSSATTANGSNTLDQRSYGYDNVGNRTSQTINGTTTNMSYNAANELTSDGSRSYSYDANGNLVSRSDGLGLTYNAANFTTAITPPGGSPIQMTYSGVDQSERVKAGNTSFVYDLTGLSQRTDANGTVYEIRDTSGQLLEERRPDGTFYIVFDAVGSTIALTDGSGNLVSDGSYNPFDNQATGMTSTPFQFDGAYLDSATDLYKMGVRYYDPNLGRFTQMDPLFGKFGNPQTLNRYVFALNNPVTLTDRTGASLLLDWLGFGLAVLGLALAVVAFFISSPVLLIVGLVAAIVGVAIAADTLGCDYHQWWAVLC